MGWNPLSRPVDYIKLNDKKSPGIAEVVGANRRSQLKKFEPHEMSKGYVAFRGIRLAEFSVDLRLYTEQDWADWYAWKPLVMTPPKRDTDGLSIWHPILEELKVGKVLVEDVLQPKQTADGEWTITIKFCEFDKPSRQSSKPIAAKATPVDHVDTRIEALTNQYNALAGPRPPPLPVRR